MRIEVRRETKVRVARIGPQRTFGDYESRQKQSDEEVVSLFDHQWDIGLRSAVERAHDCECEVARSRLQEKHLTYIDSDQEQKQFRFQNMEFIAQLKELRENEYELTQLWRVQSGDDHPKTLWITFDTVAERKRFKSIAEHLQRKDEDLGLEIVRDFITKFDNVVPLIAEDDDGDTR